MRSPWALAFAAVTVVHLALNAADATPWDSITKCLLAPLLVGWVIEQRGPRLLVVALTFCFLGDLLLELPEAFFVGGMAAFAAAHVCFVRFFVQHGAMAGLRATPWIPVALAVVAVALIAWCWSGLEADIRPFIPVYALLLASTAATALVTDRVAGLGAVLFLVSDGIIAASVAGRLDPDAVATGLAIMALYLAAIALLAVGVVNLARRSQRTDCWPTLPDRAEPV